MSWRWTVEEGVGRQLKFQGLQHFRSRAPAAPL